MATYKSGEKFFCPHCEEEQEDVVDDYVVPNQVGVESESDTQCHECDKWFRVVKDPDGRFDVSESD